MKITFLGTSAATSCPMPFCRCKFCETAKKRKGRDLRKRSSILINKDLLIDFGPDIMSASFMYDVSITDVRYLLQTHSHADHFDPSAFGTRFHGYAVENIPKLELYGSKLTIDKLSQMVKDDGYIQDLYNSKEQEELKLKVFPVKHYQTFQVGDYEVTAFPSNHDKSCDSIIYSIFQKNLSILYGTDTDTLSEDFWLNLHKKKIAFDIVVLDHTYGLNINGGGHLNANKFIKHINRMKKENLLKSNARVFATHISHEGNYNYDEFSEYAKKYNYEVAYDGLKIIF